MTPTNINIITFVRDLPLDKLEKLRELPNSFAEDSKATDPPLKTSNE